MKRKRLTVPIVLLTLAFACLFSATVFSGEHPWDADHSSGSGGSAGIPGGSSSLDDPTPPAVVVTSAPYPSNPGLDLRSQIFFKVWQITAKYFYPRLAPLKNTRTNSHVVERAK